MMRIADSRLIPPNSELEEQYKTKYLNMKMDRGYESLKAYIKRQNEALAMHAIFRTRDVHGDFDVIDSEKTRRAKYMGIDALHPRFDKEIERIKNEEEAVSETWSYDIPADNDILGEAR